MIIIYNSFSKTGLKCKTNQDRITTHANEKMSLFAVADGMGGHSKGEFASESVIKYLDMLWNEISDFSGDLQTAVDMVIAALEKANAEVFKYAEAEKIICGSTASVLLIRRDFFAVINIGDSPVYYADNKSFVHASTEHNYGTVMQKSTLISPDEIDNKRKDKLVQAIGTKENIYPSVRTGLIKSKTIFLLCSDGISRYFTDKKIKKQINTIALKKNNLSEFSDALKDTAYKRGAEDNLSAITVLADMVDKEGLSTNQKIILALFSVMTVVFIIWIIINWIILK